MNRKGRGAGAARRKVRCERRTGWDTAAAVGTACTWEKESPAELPNSEFWFYTRP